MINSQALKRTGGKYKSMHGHEELYTPAGIFARLEMQAKFKSDHAGAARFHTNGDVDLNYQKYKHCG